VTSVSKIALGLSVLLGTVSPVAVSAQQQAAPAAPAREYKLSKEERNAIAPLQEAVNAKNTAAAQAALPAARSAAKGADAQYIVGQLMLKLGLDTKDVNLQRQAIDVLVATPSTPQTDMATLYLNQAALASQAGDAKGAEAAIDRAAQLNPNDPNVIVSQAEAKLDAKKPAEAVALIEKAIQLKAASGQQVPETWYKRALSLALQNKMAPQSAALSKALIAAYPTQTNWRDALLIYRDSSSLDETGEIDLMRLMRATKALNGERDYYRFASQLRDRGLPGESKAVLDEGVAVKMVDPAKSPFKELIAANNGQVKGDQAALAGLETKAGSAADGKLALSTADAYYGYGNYTKAAALYRTALQKGNVDANIVNTRLGAALALAGQKAEAEAALKAVQGPRADLAAFWLAWLAQRA
jgi:predicted Zn-dependent protease